MWNRKIWCLAFYIVLLSSCDSSDPVAPIEARLKPSRIKSAISFDRQNWSGTCPSVWRPNFLAIDDDQYVVESVGNPRSVWLVNQKDEIAEERLILPEGSFKGESFIVSDKFFQLYYNPVNESAGIMALNRTGEVTFDTDFPDFNGLLKDIEEISSGEYLLLFAEDGFRITPGKPRNNLVSMNESGQVLWSRPVVDSTSTYPTANDVAVHADGRLVVAGVTNYPNAAGILESYDRLGNLEWKKEYTARHPEDNKINHVFALRDGHTLVIGASARVPSHTWVFEVDAMGTVVWDSEESWTEQDLEEGYAVIDRGPLLFDESVEGIILVTTGPWGSGVSYRSYFLDRSGNLVQKYDWPMSFNANGLPCGLGHLQHNLDNGLVFVASCEDMVSNSNICRGKRQTAVFTLE